MTWRDTIIKDCITWSDVLNAIRAKCEQAERLDHAVRYAADKLEAYGEHGDAEMVRNIAKGVDYAIG
jgi:hypothetical protein